MFSEYFTPLNPLRPVWSGNFPVLEQKLEDQIDNHPRHVTRAYNIRSLGNIIDGNNGIQLTLNKGLNTILFTEQNSHRRTGWEALLIDSETFVLDGNGRA